MRAIEKFIDSNGHKVWTGAYGDTANGQTPLLVIHGGPGFPHYYLQDLSELANRGIPVVMYDQLGCGKSDHPHRKSWTIELFTDEVTAVRNALDLQTIDILGHSWGGGLAVEYLSTKPRGVRKLILSSPLLDTKLWIQETNKLRDRLPRRVAETLRKHEAAGTTDSEDYHKAVMAYNDHFLCRRHPWPPELRRTFDEANMQIYETMWGPSEDYATGSLKNWSVLDKLGEITIPTLLVSGKYDEATPKQMRTARHMLPNSQWKLLEHSAHMMCCKEPEKYLKTVEDFLKADRVQ